MIHSKNKNVLLIDCGHSSWKIGLIIDGIPIKQISVPFQVVQVSSSQISRSPITEYESQFFAVGVDAYLHLPPEHTAPTDDSVIGSRSFLIMFISVLVTLKLHHVENVFIAIPDGLLRTKNEMLLNLLERRHDLGKGQSCEVNRVQVLGQGVMTAIAKGKALRKGRCVFIDAGHKTILIFTRDGPNFMSDRSRTIDLGGHRLIQSVASSVTESDSQRLRLEADLLSAFYRKSSAQFRGQTIKLAREDKALKVWVEQVMQQLFTVIRSADDINNFYLSGGAGHWIADEIAHRAPHATVTLSDNPRFEVLAGLSQYAAIKK